MKKRYFTIVIVNLILLIVFLIYHSLRRTELDAIVLCNKNIHQIDSLKTHALLKKDVLAYNVLRILYQNKPNEGELLVYSIVMANRCHYPQAYFDVYHELRFVEHMDKNGAYSSEETKKLMIHYLMEGAKLGNKQSMHELGKLYIEGEDLPQDTILGKRLIHNAGIVNAKF